MRDTQRVNHRSLVLCYVCKAARSTSIIVVPGETEYDDRTYHVCDDHRHVRVAELRDISDTRQATRHSLSPFT
jgi:hypothetical protein